MNHRRYSDLRNRCFGALLAALLLPLAAHAADPAVTQPFEALDGEMATLDDYAGQVVVLNLWAVWCPPCLAEIPHLVRLQPELEAHGATIVGLALDSGSADAIRGFWRRRLASEPEYPIWRGTVEHARTHFDMSVYPATLIIDRDGIVRERLVGVQTRDDLWAAVVPYL
jgi:thiol-disulfide isomerase/thioredoxin